MRLYRQKPGCAVMLRSSKQNRRHFFLSYMMRPPDSSFLAGRTKERDQAVGIHPLSNTKVGAQRLHALHALARKPRPEHLPIFPPMGMRTVDPPDFEYSGIVSSKS
jgi:hypothetical protein